MLFSIHNFSTNRIQKNTSWKIIDAKFDLDLKNTPDNLSMDNPVNSEIKNAYIHQRALREIIGIVIRIEEDSLFMVKSNEKIQKARIKEITDKSILIEQNGKLITYNYKLTITADAKYCVFTPPNNSGGFMKAIKIE